MANQTVETDASVDDFLDTVAADRRADARALTALMARATGEAPAMWGPAIIGFGGYHYRYDSGREGDSCRVGFSPRKAALTLYLGTGHPLRDDLLGRLGRHTTGKGCVYVKRLADVDLAVLEELIATSYADNRRRYLDDAPSSRSAASI